MHLQQLSFNSIQVSNMVIAIAGIFAAMLILKSLLKNASRMKK